MGIRDFEKKLASYAELAIKVGLNLQPGQRLLITNVSSGGVVLEAAPMVRQIAAAAYRAERSRLYPVSRPNPGVGRRACTEHVC